jgi:D-glycero-alpha-D-manno-heptose 1-phosphate guanylyltransferase
LDREDTLALLLVGGMGTRLRSVLPTTPKPLAPVGKESFLHLLVRQLQSQCIQRLVMCTGYLADRIRDEFGDGRNWGVAIEYSKESNPRGTAGAVKLAQCYLSFASDFVVLNGDSFLELDFHELIDFHRKQGGVATIAVRRVENAMRYGTVRVDTNNRIIGFQEKTGMQGPGLVNGGVYVFSSSILEYIPDGPSSLENDIFPRILGRGVYALEQHGIFIDIGTPEDYGRAQELCISLYDVANGKTRSGNHDIRTS